MDDVTCVEHVWVLVSMTLGWDGTHLEHECARCGTFTVEGPAELRGDV